MPHSAITALIAGIPVTGSTRSSRAPTAAGITHGPVETYGNGVRHVDVPDPDGNAIALAEAPGASTSE